jgi:hypothetical protein
MKGKSPTKIKMVILTIIVTIIVIMAQLTLFTHDDKLWNSIPPVEEEYYPVEHDARY